MAVTPSIRPSTVMVRAAIRIIGIAMRQYLTASALTMRTMIKIPALSWGCGGWIGTVDSQGACSVLRDRGHRLVPRRQRALAWPARLYRLSRCARQPVRRGSLQDPAREGAELPVTR